MKNISRFLITTANERTWKFDRPVLFLGEWCRRYDRRELWASMDAIVAEPYGLSVEQKDKDFDYVTNLYNELLVELSDILNEYHNTDHCLRYWRILLGHWLHRYTLVIFNRWATLQQALNNYKIFGTTILDANDYSLATQDSYSFFGACNDDVWNHVLYSKILNFSGTKNLEIEEKPLDSVHGFVLNQKPLKPKVSNFRYYIFKSLEIIQFLSRNKDAFIILPFLPVPKEIILKLRLGQVPCLWKSPNLSTVNADSSLRKNLAFKTYHYQGFDKVVRDLIMDILPTCFLEGYQTLTQHIKALPWPKSPRFIFTSNSYDFDEIFKAWTGLKVQQGVPYFTGQHGNNYGTARYNLCETNLIATSDKFITWGWTNKNPKLFPAFIFKTTGRKRLKINDNGSLLLIEKDPPAIVEICWDGYFEFNTYQDEQFQFVKNLPDFIHQKLIVRLYDKDQRFSLSDEQRWKDINPNIKIEDRLKHIRTLISSSRLVVYSYDSTGILETLSTNVPTICFWHGGLDHLRTSARPYYEQLKHAGILFDSPESAAKMVTEVWENVPAWWNSEEVQSARITFCHRYAHIIRGSTNYLKNIFLKYEKGL
jgi:putative transferase (TIGR04331 family)